MKILKYVVFSLATLISVYTSSGNVKTQEMYNERAAYQQSVPGVDVNMDSIPDMFWSDINNDRKATDNELFIDDGDGIFDPNLDLSLEEYLRLIKNIKEGFETFSKK